MARFYSNRQIAKILRSISAAYTVKGGDYFKITAYDKAADSVEHTTSELKDLWDDGKMDTVPGLGKAIQLHLDELFRTGNVRHFDQIKSGLPKGMFELLDVPGMGPKSAYKIAKALKVKNIKDLEVAARRGKIAKLPGFGPKSQQDILSSISEFTERTQRLILPFAHSVARMVATVGDIDIAVASKSPQKIIDHFKSFREVSRVLEAGSRTSSVVLKNGVQVDLMIQPPDAFGALLQHFTGSKNHNIHLRELALKRGFSLSEYGIKAKVRLMKFRKEEEFYKFLGLDFIEPELREDMGEIESAQTHTLPELIELEDIKGDIHLHSSYPIEPSHDLGANTFEDIIEKAKSLGYEYIGFSDHSPSHSTHTKQQIIDLIGKRSQKIEQLKSSSKDIGILNLLEIDILASGELSIPEESLKFLDGSLAGIHSSHRQDKKTMTKRILVACNSPYVQVVSHPTGRLLQERESYEVDWPRIFEVCVKTKTMLEINAWPNRLDLPDALVREAVGAGVKLIINSDSHQINQMDNMRFGVAVGRRGWATAKDIANTLPWVEFRKLFKV